MDARVPADPPQGAPTSGERMGKDERAFGARGGGNSVGSGGPRSQTFLTTPSRGEPAGGELSSL